MPSRPINPNFDHRDIEFTSNPSVKDVDSKLNQSLSYLLGYDNEDNTFRLVRVDNAGRIVFAQASSYQSNGEVRTYTWVGAAAKIVAVDNVYRSELFLQNVGITSLYIGFDDAVTNNNGFQFDIGESIIISGYTGKLYVYSNTASGELRLMEIGIAT